MTNLWFGTGSQTAGASHRQIEDVHHVTPPLSKSSVHCTVPYYCYIVKIDPEPASHRSGIGAGRAEKRGAHPAIRRVFGHDGGCHATMVGDLAPKGSGGDRKSAECVATFPPYDAALDGRSEGRDQTPTSPATASSGANWVR